MNQDKTEGLSVTLVLVLFFVSGALALVYEVVWAREMMHVFGSTALAVGTVSGVLLTGFFLIGMYGIHIPVYMAVIGNLLIGCIAWMASLRISESLVAYVPPAAEADDGPDRRHGTLGSGTFRVILFGLGISGFTSFAYEIYWTRSLVFILGNSTYALTTMLSAFLSGIALGGYLIRFFLKGALDRSVIFGRSRAGHARFCTPQTNFCRRIPLPGRVPGFFDRNLPV